MSEHIVIDARIRRSSTGRYTDRLVEHLQDIDRVNRYTVLVQPDDDWQMRAGNFRTLPCPFPQFSLNPLNELRFAWQLYRLKPDLVHFTMTQQPLLYFGKIVTTTHDLTMFYFVRRGGTSLALHNIKMGLYRFLVKWSHRKSSRIIVPARTIAEEVAEFQPSTKNKLAVTYEGPGQALGAQAKQPEGISGDFIMYLGTAFPHKNLPRLVEAFDILHKKRPKLQLVMVGKREKHYEALEAWIASHPSHENIHITGFLPDDQTQWLYAHCLTYVTPTLMEGWGLTALEAMANGAPVACGRVSVLPEVYGDAACYFDPYSPQDIAEKVSQLLDDQRLRNKLRAASREQIRKYSWRKMAKETFDVYADVLASSRNP